MRYKNISSSVKLIVRNSVKTRVFPGGIVNLKPSDANHTGSNMRYFQLVDAEDLVRKENLSEVKNTSTLVLEQSSEEVQEDKIIPEENTEIPKEESSEDLLTENEATEDPYVETELSDIVGAAEPE